MSTPHYHINLLWSAEDQCWIADVPDLRYCSAHGDTPQETVAEVQVAIELFLDSIAARGQPLPEPRYRPSIYAARFAA